MAELSSWAEANWQPLAALLVQLAFLTAAVWFARSILKTIRSFQEQIGALLKLTIATPLDARNLGSATVKSSFAESSPYWLTPSETQTVSAAEPGPSGPSGLTAAWRALVLWMQAPMNGSGIRPWRRVVTWLRSPVGAPAPSPVNVGEGHAVTQAIEYPRSSIMGLGITNRSETTAALDDSVNQALGGRLKSY